MCVCVCEVLFVMPLFCCQNERTAEDTGKSFNFASLVSDLRTTFESGKTKSIAWRRKQLQQIQLMCKENHEEITAAVRGDRNGYKMRGIMELMPMFEEASFALKHLDAWAKPKPVNSGMVPTTRAVIRPEPKGVMLIIAPWNYPISLALQPLVSAIAAGLLSTTRSFYGNLFT